MARHPEPIPIGKSKGLSALQAMRTAATTGNKAVTMSAEPSHFGLRSFMPIHCKRPLIGCRNSVKTANEKSQSSDAGFVLRSYWYAAFPSAQTLSKLRSLGTNSGISRFQLCGDEEGRYLSNKRCSSVRGSPDSLASSSIRPITKSRAVSKSEFRFINVLVQC